VPGKVIALVNAKGGSGASTLAFCPMAYAKQGTRSNDSGALMTRSDRMVR
jgi:hypothetical protein